MLSKEKRTLSVSADEYAIVKQFIDTHTCDEPVNLLSLHHLTKELDIALDALHIIDTKCVNRYTLKDIVLYSVIVEHTEYHIVPDVSACTCTNTKMVLCSHILAVLMATEWNKCSQHVMSLDDYFYRLKSIQNCKY